MKKAFLLLADGTVLAGTSVGHEGQSTGEVVFNTGMVGYQEVLSDPACYGQIVSLTYPLVGNYGVNFEEMSAHKSWVSGLVVRELCEAPSNWRSRHTLDDYLKAHKIVGLAGIDTRRLTRILRNSGVMNGIIYTEGYEPDAKAIEQMKAFTVQNALAAVATGETAVHLAEGETKFRVALLDFGATYDFAEALTQRGCEVTVLPGDTAAETVLAGGYDGAMLSSGPGDPAENKAIAENLRELRESGLPLFGVGLGHQLMCLAIGAKTEKLHYGHRGVSQPVKDLDTDRTYITSQNHGYAVLGDTVDEAVAHVRYVNLNDGTVEGAEHRDRPVFTVQYRPEYCPGPMDTSYLFDVFVANMEKHKGGAQ